MQTLFQEGRSKGTKVISRELAKPGRAPPAPTRKPPLLPPLSSSHLWAFILSFPQLPFMGADHTGGHLYFSPNIRMDRDIPASPTPIPEGSARP